MTHDAPTPPTAPDPGPAAGGRTTKTTAGIVHIAPRGNAAADIVPELLTTREAARLAGVGERTWWAWSRSGLAPGPVTIGHGVRPAVRYRRSEIMAWISSGCPRVDAQKTGGARE